MSNIRLSNKTKKIIVVSAVAVGVAVVAFLLFKGKKGNPLTLPPVTTPDEESCLTFPLKYGDGYADECEQRAVKVIQIWLNLQDWLFSTWVDGKFGSDTESLLYQYTGRTTVDREFYEMMKVEIDPNYVRTTLSY